MGDRAQFLGRLASATQLVFAGLFGGLASLQFEPGFVPRGTLLLIVFALPAIVGFTGTTKRRPALLAAAGVTSAIGAFIAFSGVTLIFLMPALLFLVAAVRLALTTTGLALSALLPGIARLVISAAVVVLIVGTEAAGLLITDSACWSEFRGPTGVRIETAPYSTGAMEIPPGATVSGCSTGNISARGVGLAGVLALAALGMTCLVARRPPADG
jgi:hypothetical protein